MTKSSPLNCLNDIYIEVLRACPVWPACCLMITGPSAVGVAATIPSSTLSSEFILEANAEDGDVPSKRMHRCVNKTCRNFLILKLDVGRFY